MDGSAGSSVRVTALVLHWGDPADTRECVASLLGLDYEPLAILVLNNGAPPESLDLPADSPLVSVRHLEDNLGFGAAANLGMGLARDNGSRFAWLVNNDCVVTEPECLSLLVDEALERGLELLSPCIRNVGSSGIPLPSYGDLFVPGLGLTCHRRRPKGGLLSRFFHTRPFLSASALLVDLEKAPRPLFDEAFFAYYEDVDLCLGMSPGTFDLYSDCSVLHKVSRSTRGTLRKHYLKARNLVYLMRKHGLSGFRFSLCYWLLFVPVEARRYFRQPLAFLRSTVRGWRDGRRMSVGRGGAPLPD